VGTSLRRHGLPRPFNSRLNNTLWQEFRFSSIPELVRMEDALGMAFSVEARSPFLDHRFVEFCFSLPPEEKIASGWTKHVLREAMRGVLPEAVRLRRDKHGLPAPNYDYMVAPGNFEQIQERLIRGIAVQRGIFDPGGIEDLLARFRRSKRRGKRLEHVVWRCLCLEIWLEHVRRLTAEARDMRRSV